ncbi:MAG: glycoside hydrolase family 3 C-terminal domain-containing protein, partial [Bacteroidales bacterium]
PDAIAKGLIMEATVDSILRPLLRTRFRLGLFDPPEMVPWSTLCPEVVNSLEHRALAYEAAVKSIVLLQNKNQVLPLDRDSIRNIFVTGPTSADVMALVGNYNGWSGDMVTFLEGIISAVDVGTVVDYSQGCFMNTPGDYTGFWEAKMADVIVMCLGNSKMMEGEEGEAMLNPEGGDRSDIRLPESQREFTEGEKIHAELTIINTGDRAGEEVVLVYASKAGKSLGKPGFYMRGPEKTLVGFSRVFLEAGESKTIPIEADLLDMHQWDAANQKYFVEKGNYVLQVDPCGSGGFSMQVEIE